MRFTMRGCVAHVSIFIKARLSRSTALLLLHLQLISWEDYGVAQDYVRNISAKLDQKDFVGAYLIWDGTLSFVSLLQRF